MKNVLIREEDLELIINELIKKDTLDEKTLKVVLMYASTIGNIEQLKYILNKNIDVNLQDDKGKTALIHATINNKKAVVELLIDHGADINIKDKRGLTAIKYAIKNNNVEIANILTNYGAVINKTKPKSNISFVEAANKNNYKLVNLFIEDGININLQDQHGWTALHHAVWNNNYELVKLLLKNDINPNIITNREETALIIGVSKKVDLEIINLLLEYKTEINAQDYLKRTALMGGNEDKNNYLSPKITELLLKNGANPNMPDVDGYTALMQAVNEESIEKVELLLNYKADPNLIDESGMTALHYAVIKGNIRIAKLLLEYSPTNALIVKNNPYGADPNIKTLHSNISILGRAIKRYDLEMIRLLLEHGANPNERMQFDFYPIHIAIEYPPILKLLLEYRADPNIDKKDSIFEYTLKRMARNLNYTYLESLELLIGYGLNVSIKECKKIDFRDDYMKNRVLYLLKNAKKVRKAYLQKEDLYKVEEETEKDSIKNPGLVLSM